MKVLIVDDEPLARDELSYLLEQNDLIDDISKADGVNSAREEVEKNRPDLIFLDIQLDDGSGMAFAKSLKKRENSPYIVFATAYDQYALDAFEADAIDYVLKPFEQERVNDAVKRVAKLLVGQNNSGITEQQKNPRISLTNDERTIVVQKRNILYVQAQAGKALVHTEDQEILSKQTLNSIINSLDPHRFIRVHRSFVVNLNKVHELQPSFNHTYELTLVDGSKIPVSRSYVTATKQALGV
ncbi:MAG: LytTR family DNA-binding domain-containing protein [Limosilactobacillus sp.]|jgi:two-component system response regulator LytT|uniref:LytR/AlgR family response regulator transcription factor n=1 Tax=Limosilactobacillus sp. TaxID=2773925 RepID=UPI0025BCB136|nr:LytTR family DNA-binding domain-containing protein [Limosilactobacillus sp.]MCI1975506.1 LytTR family DNA-binding domain-containing protein [Limosilactobacillus sp.]MCI2030751.1 LytTR family DNA-binding domain-containing protein [Limosilactobacillus sp.]